MPAAADDGRDAVPVVPPPAAQDAVVAATHEGPEHLEIARQHTPMIAWRG